MEELEKIKAEIDVLIEKINQWNYEYYALDLPSVDDALYDKTINELKKLEQKYPSLKRKDSPTSRVGGFILDKFEKIKHYQQMLSLDNIFNKEELEKFVNTIYNSIGNNKCTFVVEPKIDGLSISIVYENSKIKYCATRGDGEVGEDVTTNVLTIKDIPQYIKNYNNETIEVRGEIYLANDDFLKLNLSQPDNKKFANPRNAAAGSLRNLDSSIAASRNLKSFLYYLPNATKMGIKTHYESIVWLKENNFQVANQIYVCNNTNEIWTKITELSSKRNTLGYEIDGVVIKVNEYKFYEELGVTSKFPKWSIAYKFPPTIVSTQLLGITTTVGRTGKITYVANLDTVNLDGSNISSASLHNKDFITNKDIRIYDYVNIYKAGDVIPYVDNVLLNKRLDNSKKYIPITNCPSCGSNLIDSDDGVDQFCINDNCDEKNIRNIEYFCSRDIMNVEGVSISIISKLYENNIIKNNLDLYFLKNKKEEIFSADINIKEKSFSNITNSIENSKNNSLERVIASFAIKGVGINIATVLSKKYKNIDNLIKASIDELNKLNIIGEKISNNIYDFFNKENNLIIIEQMKKVGINMNYMSKTNTTEFQKYSLISSSIENQKYHNKNYVITGSFSQPRSQIKLILEECYTSKVSGTITKNTDFLISGLNGGSKITKASDLNVTIIENEFWNIFEIKE